MKKHGKELHVRSFVVSVKSRYFATSVSSTFDFLSPLIFQVFAPTNNTPAQAEWTAARPVRLQGVPRPSRRQRKQPWCCRGSLLGRAREPRGTTCTQAPLALPHQATAGIPLEAAGSGRVCRAACLGPVEARTPAVALGGGSSGRGQALRVPCSGLGLAPARQERTAGLSRRVCPLLCGPTTTRRPSTKQGGGSHRNQRGLHLGLGHPSPQSCEDKMFRSVRRQAAAIG